MDYNDYELVYLACENDEDAINILLNKYDALIKSVCDFYAKKYFYYISGIDFDDLMQEARISLYFALKNYNSDSEFLFYSFVILVVKRRILTLLNGRYKKKFSSISIDDDESCLQISDNFDSSPDVLAIANELENLIINFRCMLDFEDAAIFDLRYSYFSYNDIAIILDMNIKTIDNKLIKIRKKLKKYLLKP